MIQRIQSVYLLSGCLFLASNFLLSEVWTGPAAEHSDWFTPVSLGLNSLGIAGGLFSIALFRNRDRQLQVISAIMVTSLAGLIVVSFCLYSGGILPGVESVEANSIQPLLAVITPLSATGLFTMARRGVNTDIKLLRSVDRLR
ncbi:MAG: DUF4293 family protein [Bacteroidetes bacterium]|nr:MAG: DUF4293 family protein [Bacteroidota bacterium]